MIKVPNTKGIYYTISEKTKKKTYFYRYSALENGVTKRVTKKLSDTLVVAKKMIPYIDKGHSIPEARAFVLNKTIDSKTKVMTFGRLIEIYLTTAKGLLSEHEYKTRKSRFDTHVLPYKAKDDNQLLIQKDIQTLTYSYFQQYINHLDSQNTLGVIKCSRKTQDHFKSVLQAVFTFASKEGLYTKFNPLQYVTIKAYDNHKQLTITDDEISSLFLTIKAMTTNTLEDRKKRLFFIFMIHGRRKTETLKIKWTDLNLNNREYQIIVDNSKSRKTQYLKMTDWLFAEIMDLRSQIDIKDFDTYVFLNHKTETYYSGFPKTFKSIKKEAGIKSRFTIHEFRHIIGTIGVRRLDKKLHEVGEALTHSSDEVTKIYVDKTAENSKNVIDDILHFTNVIPKTTEPKDELKDTLEHLIKLLKK